jgi:peptidoglycan/LPS O-acetylase OafA/YrhL
MPGCRPLGGMVAIPQAWSLAIELAFYAVTPFIVVLGTRAVIAVLIPAAIIKASIVVLGLHETVWGRMFMPAEMTYFMLGMLAFAFFYRRNIAGKPYLQPIYILPVAIAPVVAYEQIAVALYQNNSIWLEIIVDPIFFGMFVVLIPLLFHATRNAAWDNWIGEWSYPIDITHLLALSISMTVLDGQVFSSPWPRFLIHLALIILLATTALFAVVRPIDRLRGRGGSSSAAPSG